MLKSLRQNVIEYLRANIVAYFFIILIFIIGVVVGALAVKTLPDNQKSELISYMQIFFQILLKGTEASVSSSNFSTVILNNLKTIGLMWILGFTIVGIPFVLFIVFTRGFVIGFSVGFLVNEYIFKGLIFALAAILPHNLFAVPAVIATGVAATCFSLMLVQRRIKTKSSLWSESIGYTCFCIIMIIFMLLASLVEVYISSIFMKGVAAILLKQI